jgi:hypothetical protein
LEGVGGPPERQTGRSKPAPPPALGRAFPLDLLADYRRRPATPLETVKAARAAMVWHGRPLHTRLWLAFRLAKRMVQLPFVMVAQWLRHGQAAKRASGRGHLAQFADMWRNVMQRGIEVAFYYRDGIYRAAASGKDRTLLAFPLYCGVADVLIEERLDGGGERFGNKVRFAAVGASLGLPVVPTLLHLEAAVGDRFDLPDQDFIVKPASGMQGVGIEGWRRDSGAFRAAGGPTLDAAGLRAHLLQRAASTRHGVLLQPWLRNHPDLRAFTGDALSTTRVTTIRSETGAPEIVEAFFRTSHRRDAVVDNFHAGGWLFPIDRANGLMTLGCYTLAADRSEPRHNREIDDPRWVGRTLPHWPAIAALALRSHSVFPDLFIAGWDIAVTPEGPVAVEVNVPPGITVPRQLVIGGLAQSRLVDILAWHSQRWLERHVPAPSRWRAGE